MGRIKRLCIHTSVPVRPLLTAATWFSPVSTARVRRCETCRKSVSVENYHSAHRKSEHLQRYSKNPAETGVKGVLGAVLYKHLFWGQANTGTPTKTSSFVTHSSVDGHALEPVRPLPKPSASASLPFSLQAGVVNSEKPA